MHPSVNQIIFTEDLKAMIHVAETSDDISTVLKMITRLQSELSCIYFDAVYFAQKSQMQLDVGYECISINISGTTPNVKIWLIIDSRSEAQ